MNTLISSFGTPHLSRRTKSFIGGMVDRTISVIPNRILFVTKSNVPISGNLRIVADKMLRAGDHEVFVYKDGPIAPGVRLALENAGATVMSGFSLPHLRKIMSCETVMLSHSVRDAHIRQRKPGRKIVNLWHGVPTKRIELLMTKESGGVGVDESRLALMRHHAGLYDEITANNEQDAPFMAKAFGVDIDKVTTTGLPRFTYLNSDYCMPPDLESDELRLRDEIGGRPLVLYAPTFRENSPSPLDVLRGDIAEKIKEMERSTGCVFAVRPHPYDQLAFKNMKKSGFDFLDASARQYGEVAVILRNTEVLITDYSSIWYDFQRTKRKLISLQTDYDRYNSSERGFVTPIASNLSNCRLESWAAVIDDLRSHFDGQPS